MIDKMFSATAERTRILQTHQEVPRRPNRELHEQPRPRLLRRKDRQRQGLQTVVEGSAGVQLEARDRG